MFVLQMTFLSVIIFSIVFLTCGAELYGMVGRLFDLADPMDRKLRRLAQEARRNS